jgi:hypothetical protein
MRRISIPVLLALSIFLAACSVAEPTPDSADLPTETGSAPEVELALATQVPEPTDIVQEDTEPEEDSQSSASEPTESAYTCGDPFEGISVRFSVSFWPNTDFCQHSVELTDFLSGGPPPDGIPAIDAPVFETLAEGDTWLGDSWPIMYFEYDGDARAYPLAILMWHEIVNDEVGGLPVTLTFCPLCNATIAFNRTLPDGTVLDFGTSGNLRNSDLVMYDRQTFSWWQQFTGTGVVGEMTDTQLEFLPSQIISWADYKLAHPDGMVLSRLTGHPRDYGRNPYAGYDAVDGFPFLYEGVIDGRLPAVARVVAVEVGGEDVAYPFSELETAGVANDVIGDTHLVVFWKPGTVSALDTSSFDDARDVGSTAVFLAEVDGQVLTFLPDGDTFIDNETSTRWNIFGLAIAGPLAGTQLQQLVAAEHFWFAWAAFKPETRIWTELEG